MCCWFGHFCVTFGFRGKIQRFLYCFFSKMDTEISLSIQNIVEKNLGPLLERLFQLEEQMFIMKLKLEEIQDERRSKQTNGGV